MGKVTQLSTQAGKLAEAMALLQGHTASSIARGSRRSDVPRLTLGMKRPSPPLPTIDMVASVGSRWRLDGSPLNSSSVACRRVMYGPSRPSGRPTSHAYSRCRGVSIGKLPKFGRAIYCR